MTQPSAAMVRRLGFLVRPAVGLGSFKTLQEAQAQAQARAAGAAGISFVVFAPVWVVSQQ